MTQAQPSPWTVTMDFDVATPYPGTPETAREDIRDMVNDKFGGPLDLAKCQRHRLAIRIIIEDRGWTPG